MSKKEYNDLVLRNGYFINRKLQNKISGTTILFVGCGLASTTAVNAARLGFSKFILIDGDSVDPSNLNRQYFFNGDVGKNKAVVTAEKIHSINPLCQVEVIQQYLKVEDVDFQVNKADVIINCADFNEVVYKINESSNSCDKLSISPLNIGFGTIVTAYTKDSATLRSMTKGVVDDDKKFLLNFYSSLRGYILPRYVKNNIPQIFLSIVKNGFFPQNVIAAELSSSVIIHTIKKYLNGEKIRTAPIPIAIDVEAIYE